MCNLDFPNKLHMLRCLPCSCAPYDAPRHWDAATQAGTEQAASTKHLISCLKSYVASEKPLMLKVTTTSISTESQFQSIVALSVLLLVQAPMLWQIEHLTALSNVLQLYFWHRPRVRLHFQTCVCSIEMLPWQCAPCCGPGPRAAIHLLQHCAPAARVQLETLLAHIVHNATLMRQRTFCNCNILASFLRMCTCAPPPQHFATCHARA